MTEDDPLAPLKAPRPTVLRSSTQRTIADGSDIFFAAVETTRMPMTVTDPHQPDNPIVFANQAFIQMTGYSRDEIVGRNCRFLQGPETDRGLVNEVRRAIRDRREIATEILNYRKNGSTFWNALFISPVYNQAGDLVYFFGSQLDISRQRDAEDALRQSQKMEALGQLTGGIAHDFNNLLQVILGYVDILGERTLDAEPRYVRAVNAIRSAAEQSATLTQQLLAFSRKQRLDGRPVNLNGLVDSLRDLATRSLGDAISIETRFAPDLWNCRIDPTQAEMALLNVIINARDAMPDGGMVTVETENRVIEPEDIANFGNLAPGRYVCVAVSDHGTGMSPEVLARVMEPFFTTKEEGRGTGLGLASVYGFAKQSGGGVRIYSEVGQGTTVRLYFPATDQAVDRTLTARPRGVSQDRGAETVLLVEDRPEVAELARSILTDFGYRVHHAAAGPQALEFIDGPDQVDLLFSDLVMPGGMNGVVLAREARKRQPKLKILLTTGYAEASLERQEAGGAEFEIINKPYRRSELARRVRQLLDGPTGTA